MKHILTLIAITATLALGACASKPVAKSCCSAKAAKPDACCKTKGAAKKM